jgi:hypothetical protein
VARREQETDSGDGLIEGTVENTVQSAVGPVLKWGGGLVGLYLVLDNRELVSDLFRDLVTTEESK